MTSGRASLPPLYAQHGEAVDEIVKLANEMVRQGEEHEAAVTAVRIKMMVAVGVTILLIVVVLGYGTARGILGPLNKTLIVLRALAEGDLRQQVEVDSNDEIGTMGRALNQAIEGMSSTIRAISNSVIQVGSASEELSTTSQQITANSEETSAQARVVSGATLQVSQNLQTVATGAEEMGASIKEIAKNATEADRKSVV